MRRCDSTQTGKTVSDERAYRGTLRHDYTRPGVEPWWDTPRHEFSPSWTGRVCDRMVLRDGHWDACGLPPEHPAHMYGGTAEGN